MKVDPLLSGLVMPGTNTGLNKPETASPLGQLPLIPAAAYSLTDVLFESALSDLASLIDKREELLRALPDKLRQTVNDSLAKQSQPAQIAGGHWRELALSARTIRQELSALCHQLANPSEALAPDLRREWSQLTKPMKESVLQTLKELSESFQQADKASSQPQASANACTLFLPLYMEKDAAPYPAYLHIYREPGHAERPGDEANKELWLRIGLLTENLGMVEAVFHLASQGLDIRLSLPAEISSALSEQDLRRRLGELPLPLHHVSIKQAKKVDSA